MAGPDTKNTDALPYPIWGFGPPSPEPDTKNLDALLASLNGSAERFQTLWFSFLGLTLYLAIAALATTDRDLLLRDPQVLPLVNIKVQLLPFYIIAPLLYLVFHFYILLMLLLLARTAAPFERELQKALVSPDEQEEYRARVENALFLQLLVGMKDERMGLNSFLLGAIALLTLMLAPISTLILMQMMFLPYHSLPITWWHRVVVVGDAAMTLLLWYRLVYLNEAAGPPLLFRDRSRPLITSALGGSLVVVAFAFWLSFWEGRWAGEPWIGRRDLASTAKGVVFGLFPDRLILPNETIVGDELLEKTKKEISSRGGDFVPTIKFDDRDLQDAELAGADLRGASLEGANLREANLEETRLDGADLTSADLWRAVLTRAKLQGAILFKTNLRFALLFAAEFQGVDFSATALESPNFEDANLKGAKLYDQNLSGADLRSVKLQGANLRYAHMEGADLRSAELEGADLQHAKMAGADLRWGNLQGANLSGADLSDSEFRDTSVFRVNTADANLATANIRSVDVEPPKTSDVAGWIAAASQFAPKEDKIDVAKRFARLNPDFQENAREPTWMGMAEASLALDGGGPNHRQRLARLFGDLACDRYLGPHVALRYILERSGSELTLLADQLDTVRARMKQGRTNPEKCPGVAGFTDEDWKLLDGLKSTEAAPGDH